jgi:hypothetical protein
VLAPVAVLALLYGNGLETLASEQAHDTVGGLNVRSLGLAACLAVASVFWDGEGVRQANDAAL